eukprot:TRINITY_DN13075_c0_g1_i1.p1 TRINITY_DN13075_c0_g1~~TRINITY_DN13075_c0_g1_i1.p1  ORF type:complete len:443 (-),score=87.00 TRINITY_DN13075_c0_g1_i1:121-1449(-)
MIFLEILYGASGFVLLLTLVPSLFWFCKLRHHILIHNRGFYSSCICTISVVLFGIFGCAQLTFGPDASCASTTIPREITALIYLLFLLERCFVVVVWFQITVQSKNYGDAKLSDHDAVVQVSWLLRNRRYFHNGGLAPTKIFTAMVAFVLIIAHIAFVIVNADGAAAPDGSQACAQFATNSGLITAVIAFLILPLILESIRRLRKVQENFHIRTELRNCGLMILFAVFWVCLALAGSDLLKWLMFGLYVMLPMGHIYFSFIDVCMKVLKLKKTGNSFEKGLRSGSPSVTTRTRSRTPSGVGTRRTQEVEFILQDPVLFPLFEEFMLREFAIENVLFLKAMEQLHQEMDNRTKSKEHLFPLARSISQRFCQDESRLAVNISSQCRVQIEQAGEVLMDLSKALMDAEKEIKMLQDSLRRFFLSPKYLAVKDVVEASAEGGPHLT